MEQSHAGFVSGFRFCPTLPGDNDNSSHLLPHGPCVISAERIHVTFFYIHSSRSATNDRQSECWMCLQFPILPRSNECAFNEISHYGILQKFLVPHLLLGLVP